jgi:hypothetical protein
MPRIGMFPMRGMDKDYFSEAFKQAQDQSYPIRFAYNIRISLIYVIIVYLIQIILDKADLGLV